MWRHLLHYPFIKKSVFGQEKLNIHILFFAFIIIYIITTALLLSLLYFLYRSEWAAPTDVHLTTCGPPGKKFGHLCIRGYKTTQHKVIN